MEKQFINPPSLSTPTGYTHVVTIQGGGKLIHISGQVAWDERGNIVGKGDLSAQARQAHQNLVKALAAAGATPADLIKITTYVVNYQPAHRAQLREIRQQLFSKEHPPASTLIGVQALATDELLIEVEGIAAVN